jgi:hypothetical protein
VACDGVQPCDLQGAEREAAAAIFGAIDCVPPDCRHTVAVLKGARCGFSYVGSLRLLHLALTVDLSTMAPGEQAAGIVVAPDLRLARQAFRFVLGAVKATPSIAALMESESTDALTLRRPDGRAVTIECLPATVGGRATRGRTLVGALMDESSFFRDESYSVNDAEVYRGIAPRVVPGGQVLIGSTPWLEGVGLLATLYAANHGKPTTALAALLPTRIARTSRAILLLVEREYARDPENARREYGAEFLSAGTAQFFDNDTITIATDTSLVLPCAPRPGASVHAGADFGFTRNSSTLAVVQSLTGKCWLADLREIKPTKGNPLKPSDVGADFRKALQGWHCDTVMCDLHERESMREHLSPVRLTDAPAGQAGKAAVYIAVRDALRERNASLPQHTKLLRQLREVVSKPLPGGGIAISAPTWRSGEHNDLVSAAVLALYRAIKAGAAASQHGETVFYPIYSEALGECLYDDDDDIGIPIGAFVRGIR